MTEAAFWDRAAPKYAKDKITDQAGYEETLGRMRYHLQPNHSVLEIGCGTGSTALELAPGVQHYTGTDISPAMINLAREKLTSDAHSNLAFEVSAAGDFPHGTFDAILALNLLHLLPNLEKVLDKAHDALPPGGLFITKTGLLRDGKWYLSPLIALMRAVGKAPYVRAMTKAEYLGALTWVGFEEVETILQPGIAPRIFTVHRKI